MPGKTEIGGDLDLGGDLEIGGGSIKDKPVVDMVQRMNSFTDFTVEDITASEPKKQKGGDSGDEEEHIEPEPLPSDYPIRFQAEIKDGDISAALAKVDANAPFVCNSCEHNKSSLCGDCTAYTVEQDSQGQPYLCAFRARYYEATMPPVVERQAPKIQLINRF